MSFRRIGGMALGFALSYPSHGVNVESLPKTVVHLGVLMCIPLTVYCTLYQGIASSKYLTSSALHDESMNFLK